jgi:hypothetical protein
MQPTIRQQSLKFRAYDKADGVGFVHAVYAANGYD